MDARHATGARDMSNTNQTAGEAILAQHATICKAIELLQSDADRLTSQVDPDSARWRDVAEFAHVNAIAQQVVDAYAER